MNILISKSDAFGDQILLTGLVAQLRESQPDARIVWHVRSGLEHISQLIPGSRIFVPDRSRTPISEAHRLSAEPSAGVCLLPFPINPYTVKFSPELADQLQWWGEFIRAVNWDWAIAPLVSRNWLSDFTVGISNASRRVGFAANPTCQPMIGIASRLAGANAPPCFSEEVAADLSKSEMDNLGLLARRLTNRTVEISPRVELSPAWTAEVRARWSLDAKPYLLFAPGVGLDQKRAWPLSHFLTLAAGVPSAEFNIRWLCGPQDETFYQGFPGNQEDRIIRYTERDLGHLSALIASAQCLICNDTSVVHLAAALNTPALAIFGSAHGHRFVPAKTSVKVVQADIACRGCQWHCLFDEYACVQQIPLAQVQTAFQDLLRNKDLAPVRVHMPLAPIAGHPIADEAEWVRTAFQRKLVFQHWDAWARLQAIQELENKWMESDARGQELHRRLEKLNAATRNPLSFLRFLWRRFVRREPL